MIKKVIFGLLEKFKIVDEIQLMRVEKEIFTIIINRIVSDTLYKHFSQYVSVFTNVPIGKLQTKLMYNLILQHCAPARFGYENSYSSSTTSKTLIRQFSLIVTSLT